MVKLNLSKLFPQYPGSYYGSRIVRIITGLYLCVMIVRSCIHLFAPDGGANSIAGIDISVAGGDNIVAIFHQWGAIQLILATLLFILFFRYPGLTPLILVALALDPILRYISGKMMPVTTVGTPPGETLNGPSFLLVAILLIASLAEPRSKK